MMWAWAMSNWDKAVIPSRVVKHKESSSPRILVKTAAQNVFSSFFDEPTTGLHFHDIKKLLDALNALVEKGHTVLIVEHNMEVIKSRRLSHRSRSGRWKRWWQSPISRQTRRLI